MNRPRGQICASTSRKLATGLGEAAKARALLGFDGFVDEIIAVVDKRYVDGRFDPVRTIGAMGDKIRAAAGESTNYELVVKHRKLGGNGPILANALACLGMGVSYVGSLGLPVPDPVFAEFASRAELISIAQPGHTDALEFDDGKVMLGKNGSLNEIHWETIVERVGEERLEGLIGGANLVGMLNWTMIPRMSQIWERLADEVLPKLGQGPRIIFIDLADPEKRTPEEIRAALGLLRRFQEHAEVILGLNLKEALQINAVLDLPSHADPEGAIADEARAIREALGLSCVVIHPRRAAAAATATEAAKFDGPFVRQPIISTGAGDHFNAGFCLGRILGLDLAESLCAGVSTSGYYVRTAKSPSLAELAEFVAELPPAE
ncbi:hypothetical protein [Singulisphaera sp. PoT]|uniref:hypothetical protein n=1 Tax=Singulisphaera sp. PoT TaxID=3411797 RepID=UPI003BF5D06B